MSPNYPNSIDNPSSLPNPVPTSPPNNPSHADLHTEENNILLALENKIGSGNSAPIGGTGKFLLTSNGDGSSAWQPSGASAPSPLTTKGDLYTYTSVNARLPVGADGYSLVADSTQTTGLRWNNGGSGNVSGPTSAVVGDIATFDSTTGTLIADSGKVLPSTNIVGTSDTQTLINKSISGSSNTLTNIPLATAVSGVLPVANGGTGVTSSTGTGNTVLSTSPTLSNPVISGTTGTISTNTLSTAGNATIGGTTTSTGLITANGGLTVPSGQVATIMTALYNPYKFKYYWLNGQASLGNNSLIKFDTKIYDTSSNYSTTAFEFIAPIAGFYTFKAQIQVNTGAASGFIQVGFNHNGSPDTYGPMTSANLGGDVNIQAVDDIQCAAGDTVQVYAYMSSVWGVTGGTGTFFSGYLVSAT